MTHHFRENVKWIFGFCLLHAFWSDSTNTPYKKKHSDQIIHYTESNEIVYWWNLLRIKKKKKIVYRYRWQIDVCFKFLPILTLVQHFWLLFFLVWSKSFFEWCFLFICNVFIDCNVENVHRTTLLFFGLYKNHVHHVYHLLLMLFMIMEHIEIQKFNNICQMDMSLICKEQTVSVATMTMSAAAAAVKLYRHRYYHSMCITFTIFNSVSYICIHIEIMNFPQAFE